MDGVNLLLATGVAVETTILHNFASHEPWTWSDRTCRPDERWRRLGRFNIVSGSIAIVGNVGWTGVYVSAFGMHHVTANLLAIASCSRLNFLAIDRIVFRAEATEGSTPPGPACRPTGGGRF